MKSLLVYIKYIISKPFYYFRATLSYKNVVLHYPVNVAKNSSFEGMNAIYSDSYFCGTMGLGSYIGTNCNLNATIGRFCSIANNVRCNPGTHPYKEPFATTSPNFFSLRKQTGDTFATKQMFEEFKLYDKELNRAVKIGNDVWIGDSVFLVGGIEIKDGAMILAGAVVTKDVPAYAIVGGIPAKVIGYRYDEQTIDFLLRTQWWNNNIQWFKDNWELLCDLEKFKAYYNNNK